MALPGMGLEIGGYRRRSRRRRREGEDQRLKRRPSGCGPRAAARLPGQPKK